MITANWTEWVASRAWCGHDLGVIPPAPRALADVYALAHDAEVDIRQLTHLVSQDPVFAIRILRLANAAAFAPAGEVRSVEIAIVRLGTRAVRHALLAACFSTWAQAVDTYGSRGTSEIQHAVGTACLARQMAEDLRLPGEDAFVHGLLHDVGKLVLLRLRTQFRRLGGRPPSAEEFETALTAYHADVGAAALHLWGIPDSICEPVRWHHSPAQANGHAHAASLLYLANRLSHRYRFGRKAMDDDDTLLTDPVQAALGLRDGWLATFDQQALTIGIAAQHLVS